jgi:NADH-quinone oxidoreductase subunit F
MAEAGLLDVAAITIVPGPDDYLFGEEKALLEVIEGRDPLPRLYPPYVQGLFEKTTGDPRPTAVNNAETLANVPHVIANGADWYRSFGTERSPGTMVFTIGGDVRREAVVEMELGTPLTTLVHEVGGGTRRGRHLALVANGVSNRPLAPSELDTPLAFETLRAVGSGLGSGGFTVYDDSACIVDVATALSAFLNRGSCGQCPPCKLGTAAITERFDSLAAGAAGMQELEEIVAWAMRVTDSNRCGLGAGQQVLARGILETFPQHFIDHVAGEPCSRRRHIMAPVIEDWDPAAGKFRYRAE